MNGITPEQASSPASDSVRDRQRRHQDCSGDHRMRLAMASPIAPPIYRDSNPRQSFAARWRGQPENLRGATPATTHPCRKEGSRAPYQKPRQCFFATARIGAAARESVQFAKAATTTIVTGFSGFHSQFRATLAARRYGQPESRAIRPPFESRPRRRIPPLSKGLSGATLKWRCQ